MTTLTLDSEATDLVALSAFSALRRIGMIDYLVFIGRFQPFHAGHVAVIKAALQQAHQVIVLIGSTNKPRSTRNPFSFDERQQMILGAFASDDASRIHCVALPDSLYNDHKWLRSVQHGVASVAGVDTLDQAKRIGLIGHNKDSTSYYLSLFPTWSSVAVDNYHNLSATPIRDAYLLGAMPLADKVPASTLTVLQAFTKTAEYKRLQEEAWFIDEYRKSWQTSPYPPTFITVDAVVVQSGHILLVERDGMPGRGQWALPGGFIDHKETLLESCLRELREETGLDVTDQLLRSSLKARMTFDDPYRSARGRTVTEAFCFEMEPDPRGLPQVVGGDDARRAFWVPLTQVVPEVMFEDHHAIICRMLGL